MGKQADRLGVLRLFAFVALVALAIYFFVDLGIGYGIAALVLGLIGFNRLIGRQQALDRERERQERIAQGYADEVASLDYDFSRFDGGARYADPNHPYTGDLDVFGPKSVFALLNRTTSLGGEQALAHYARVPLRDAGQVAFRQNAIAALAHDTLAARHEFLAAAPRGEQTPAQLDRLRVWARSQPVLQEGFWPGLLIALPLFNLAWLASFVYLPFFLALLGYAPTIWLLRRYKAHVDEVEGGHHRSRRSIAAARGAVGGGGYAGGG